ncbi:DNA primase [Microscilla marina]|uniref:DNA primase n=1 Tax=Microscilla marina ATCC 23134 TaxID=313606 RepID=A1ZTC4_MICM2|nr:DNA primase [Microscilla marina]EAY26346.1 DNA primase [Microscilla marina ATCC 23134]
MRISEETIEQIRDVVDIVDVVGDFVSLKKKGGNWWAHSPFTNEKTPSFSVSPAKGIFKCFSSGKGGDAITFVMEVEKLSYPEALRYLAQKYNIELDEDEPPTPEEVARQNERESLLIALEYASKHYEKNLHQTPEGQAIGLAYFKERGFSVKTIETFELGYSLDSWEAFTKQAQADQYSLPILVKAGLTIDKNGRYFDRFRDRVIFPIHNLAGKVIAFGARILKNDKKQAKYLNSPESPVYHKSKVLYGLYQAKKSLRDDDCYLVEGYTDVISLHQAGIENVVASSGTSLTSDQIRLIRRFTPNITVLYDGDAAGIKAAIRGIDLVLEEGMNVKVVLFPDGDDPDSYVKKVGGTAFKDFINQNSQDFITFKARLYMEETKQAASGDQPFKRAEMIREVVESITKIPDAIKRSVFYRECSALLEVDEAVLIDEGNKILKQDAKKRQDRQFREQKKQAREQKRQQQLPPPADFPFDLPPPPDGEFYIQDEGLIQVDPEMTPPPLIGEGDDTDVATEPITPQDPFKSPIAFQEKEHIRILLNYANHDLKEDGKLCAFLLDEISEVKFETPIYAKMLEIFREKLKEDNIITADYFIQQHENEEMKKAAVDLISERFEISENWVERHGIFVPKDEDILDSMVVKAILRLKLRHVRKMLTENSLKMNDAQTIEAQEAVMMLHMELKSLEKEIAERLGNVILK